MCSSDLIDPYSQSKAAAEMVFAGYCAAKFKHPDATHMASARAGNVIGGGDWSPDRLVPDCIRALERKDLIEIRHPHATRPWQHVLEPLSGYIRLAVALEDGEVVRYARSQGLNPAPSSPQEFATVIKSDYEKWKRVMLKP